MIRLATMWNASCRAVLVVRIIDSMLILHIDSMLILHIDFMLILHIVLTIDSFLYKHCPQPCWFRSPLVARRPQAWRFLVGDTESDHGRRPSHDFLCQGVNV